MSTLMRNMKPVSSSVFRELSRFLNKDGPVWLSIRSIAKDLKQENIDYAVIGGLAVYAHGYERTTQDCDILLAKSDHEKFLKKLVNLGLKRKFEGAKKKFIHTNTGTSIDIIIEGEYPGDGSIGPVAFPNPKECQQFVDDINVISLSKLIDLKLTSYRSLPKTRSQDLSDVVALIKIQNLNRSFADFLHPSLRTEFENLVDDLDKEKQKGSMDNE